MAGKVSEPEIEIEEKIMEKEEKTEKRLVVFDIETKKSAGEVGGWNKAHLMGLAAAVVYDSLDDKYYTYEEDGAAGLVEHLLGADLIIGFNQVRFDYQVLAAYTPQDLRARPNLDLLQEIHKVLGFRVGLGHLGRVTLGRDKTADGLQSLKWFKEGRLDLIREYCEEDVRLTWDIYVFARDKGYLLYKDKRGHRLRVPLNLEIERFL